MRHRPWIAVGFAAPLIVHGARAYAQSMGSAPNVDIDWWRLVAAFAFCAFLALAGALALRARLRGGFASPDLGALISGWKGRGGGAREPRRLQVIEVVRLAHQVEVSLLRCDDREVLIATSAHGAFVVAPGEGVGGRNGPR